MFTIKFFDEDGSYAVFSCKTFHVSPPKKPKRFITIFDGGDEDGTEREIITKAIVENENGQTIDVIKAGGRDA